MSSNHIWRVSEIMPQSIQMPQNASHELNLGSVSAVLFAPTFVGLIALFCLLLGFDPLVALHTWIQCSNELLSGEPEATWAGKLHGLLGDEHIYQRGLRKMESWTAQPLPQSWNFLETKGWTRMSGLFSPRSCCAEAERIQSQATVHFSGWDSCFSWDTRAVGLCWASEPVPIIYSQGGNCSCLVVVCFSLEVFISFKWTKLC